MDSHSPRHNVFIADNFIDADVCRELRAQAKQSITVPAQVTKSTGRVDIDMRQTSRLFVSSETEERIAAYFHELKPRLQEYYGVFIIRVRKVSILTLSQSDFYKRHADRNDKGDSPAYIKARRISVMLFLNNESQEDQPDSYTGGTLVIWNCVNPQKPVLRVEGEPGKVTAFPSDLMHEVEAVRSGERYSIVNWFF